MSKPADWIRHRYNCEVSPFGEKVADLLYDLFDGLHHVNTTSLGKADWKSATWITVCDSDGRWSTFDTDLLTRFVVLCHDQCIRGEIEAAAHRYLRMCFSPREREGDLYSRHPTMEQAMAKVRRAK